MFASGICTVFAGSTVVAPQPPAGCNSAVQRTSVSRVCTVICYCVQVLQMECGVTGGMISGAELWVFTALLLSGHARSSRCLAAVVWYAL